MATSPNSQAVLGLLERASNPILVFNVGGRITFANSAARMSPLKLPEVLENHPDIRTLASDVSCGVETLPQDMVFDVTTDAGNATIRGVCVNGPAGVDIAFVMKGDNAGGDSLMSIKEIISLINFDLSPVIRNFLQKLEALPPEKLVDDTLSAACALADRLKRLEDLVKVFGEDVLIADDRLLIPDLMRTIIRDLEDLAMRNKASFALTGNLLELPPIYGSRRLINRALHELVENSIKHSRKFVQANLPLTIQVGFKVVGDYILISLQNLGISGPVDVGDNSFKLFVKAPDPKKKPVAAQGANRGLSAPVGRPAQAAPPKSLSIGLPLAQRIVYLHGGSIKVNNNDEEGFSILMQLPTGEPKRAAKVLDMVQAQMYAADLAKLVGKTLEG